MMESWVLLLRGVNVGGKNKLPMKAFAAELETIGLGRVRTYIQSGNAVFRCPRSRAPELATEIRAIIQSKFGFEPEVTLISGESLAAVAAANPFPESASDADSKNLHLFFLERVPQSIDQDRLEAMRGRNERWALLDRVFYLHTPDGFGVSKLATQVEKSLGVSATARNWRTVRALLDLVEQAG